MPVFEADFPEIIVCPICSGQIGKSQAVVYQLVVETFTLSEPFLFYCPGCYTKYNLQDTITHMGNTYQRLRRRKK